MDKVFKGLICINVEVYVDDIIVKSYSCGQHEADLAEVFEALRKGNMRLNSDKCVFRVQVEKFLRFMLMHRGIEVNLD